MPVYSKNSKTKLKECHLDLQVLFNEVIKVYDCAIICGHRDEKEQNQAYRDGFSKLMFPKSKHNRLPAEAVDAVPYPIDWNNIERFEELGVLVLEIADMLYKERKIYRKVRWGGHFKSFKDYPHFELV